MRNHGGDLDSSGVESWKRLPLTISHDGGAFTFNTFPDTGSATTLIAKDIAECKRITETGETPSFKYVNVSGDIVLTEGIANLKLTTDKDTSTDTQAVILPVIKNEVIVSRAELQRLNVIPKQFPAPIMVISQDRFREMTRMKERLIRDNPKVLTDALPTESMEGCLMKIYLTPGDKTPFRISTACQVPLHWREKAEKAVHKLLNERVITRQEEPTEWCAPGFFVIKKNRDLRLVIDYTHLNKYMRRPVHTFSPMQDILAGLDPTSRVFAKLDATQGYHQVPLEEESSKLTTFLLPSGRFRFHRAPMGLSCSSDEFCKRSDKIIEGLPGAKKTSQQHSHSSAGLA